MNGASVGDVSSGPPDRRLYQSGPWLVAYGRGPDSNDAANQVHEQCSTRGVETVLLPIEEIKQVRIDRFTGLVVVLPSQLGNPSLTLLPFARLIGYYRARRPEGLESIINGRCEWFKAGVVQVVGPHAIMQHPAIRTALDRVCARHDTNASGLLNVFQPYARRFVLAKQLGEQPTAGKVRDENIERLWRDVQTWGVTDLRYVPTLRKCIDSFHDSPHNDVTAKNIIKELNKIVPELTRPGGRDNTKDAQRQLSRLYRNLRIIESYTYGSHN